MRNGKDELVAAIRAYEARQLPATNRRLAAEALAAAAAKEYFARVVHPAVANVRAEAEGARLPLGHLKGTLARAEGGARIRETLAMLGRSPYGDTRASPVLIDWWGGTNIHVTGRVQNQVGSWPIKKDGVIEVGDTGAEVEWLVRECLIGIVGEC